MRLQEWMKEVMFEDYKLLFESATWPFIDLPQTKGESGLESVDLTTHIIINIDLDKDTVLMVGGNEEQDPVLFTAVFNTENNHFTFRDANTPAEWPDEGLIMQERDIVELLLMKDPNVRPT